MDGIPVALPALLYARRCSARPSRRASTGAPWWPATPTSAPPAGGCFDAVDAARRAGDDAENELRIAAERGGDRYRAQEARQYDPITTHPQVT